MIKQEQQILQSWHSNAAAWITTIANEEIESRRLVTNAAVISAIADCKPGSLLDLGCGEGWLCREAARYVGGLGRIAGLDAIPGLVSAASAHGMGEFEIKSYQDIIEGRYIPSKPFDVVVFNFSLFGNELVEKLLTTVATFISQDGHLVIQTLHPHTACGELAYQDGWREGSWSGFSQQFKDPAPWYFRTLESWTSLLHACGYVLINVKEPVHPLTGKPASVIFTCQPSGGQ